MRRGDTATRGKSCSNAASRLRERVRVAQEGVHDGRSLEHMSLMLDERVRVARDGCRPLSPWLHKSYRERRSVNQVRADQEIRYRFGHTFEYEHECFSEPKWKA